MTPPAAAITRRPETAADAVFRFALFCASRQPHESPAGLGAVLEEQLMRHQFAGQEASYRAAYPSARHEIVEVDGEPVGRVVVDEGRAAWTLVDIALVAAWRKRGLGGRLVAEVMAGARAGGRPVRLSVMAHNAGAARLYARLGFVPVAADAVVVEMVWTPREP